MSSDGAMVVMEVLQAFFLLGSGVLRNTQKSCMQQRGGGQKGGSEAAGTERNGCRKERQHGCARFNLRPVYVKMFARQAQGCRLIAGSRTQRTRACKVPEASQAGEAGVHCRRAGSAPRTHTARTHVGQTIRRSMPRQAIDMQKGAMGNSGNSSRA